MRLGAQTRRICVLGVAKLRFIFSSLELSRGGSEGKGETVHLRFLGITSDMPEAVPAPPVAASQPLPPAKEFCTRLSSHLCFFQRRSFAVRAVKGALFKENRRFKLTYIYIFFFNRALLWKTNSRLRHSKWGAVNLGASRRIFHLGKPGFSAVGGSRGREGTRGDPLPHSSCVLWRWQKRFPPPRAAQTTH